MMKKIWKNIKYCGEIGQEKIAGLKIAFVHEPEKINKVIENGLDFIFYGHTHKPWLEKNGETFIANPGTLGGVYYQATFVVIDTKTKNLELKVLEGLG